jgi:regulator of replication initiation timing
MRAHIEEAVNEIATRRQELLSIQQAITAVHEERTVLDLALDARRKRLRDINNSVVTLAGIGPYAELLWMEDAEDPEGKKVKIAPVLTQVEVLEAQCRTLSCALDGTRASLTDIQAQRTALETELHTVTKSLRGEIQTLSAALQQSNGRLQSSHETIKQKENELATLQSKCNEQRLVLEGLKKAMEALSTAFQASCADVSKLVSERNALALDLRTTTTTNQLATAFQSASSQLESHRLLMQRALELQQLTNDLRVRSQCSTSTLLDENDALQKEIRVLREALQVSTIEKEAAECRAQTSASELKVISNRLHTLEKEGRSNSVHPALHSTVELVKPQPPLRPPPNVDVKRYADEVHAVKELIQSFVKDVTEASVASKVPLPSPPLMSLSSQPSFLQQAFKLPPKDT